MAAVSVWRRNMIREKVCAGCRHDYYNWPKSASPNGDVAVSEDSHCWHMESVDLRMKTPCDIHSELRGDGH
jgi:hypothetical protein